MLRALLAWLADCVSALASWLSRALAWPGPMHGGREDRNPPAPPATKGPFGLWYPVRLQSRLAACLPFPSRVFLLIPSRVLSLTGAPPTPCPRPALIRKKYPAYFELINNNKQ